VTENGARGETKRQRERGQGPQGSSPPPTAFHLATQPSTSIPRHGEPGQKRGRDSSAGRRSRPRRATPVPGLPTGDIGPLQPAKIVEKPSRRARNSANFRIPNPSSPVQAATRSTSPEKGVVSRGPDIPGIQLNNPLGATIPDCCLMWDRRAFRTTARNAGLTHPGPRRPRPGRVPPLSLPASRCPLCVCVPPRVRVPGSAPCSGAPPVAICDGGFIRRFTKS